jgi:hypothetical protein
MSENALLSRRPSVANTRRHPVEHETEQAYIERTRCAVAEAPGSGQGDLLPRRRFCEEQNYRPNRRK